jgi:hypothetical protein
MQDVGLQRGADLRPPRRDGALEVLGHHRGERREAALRIVEQRPRARPGHGPSKRQPTSSATRSGGVARTRASSSSSSASGSWAGGAHEVGRSSLRGDRRAPAGRGSS